MLHDAVRDSFQNWKIEREAVEREMKLLLTSGQPTSVEDRRIRKILFAALIERRDAAARNFLQTAREVRPYKSPVN